MEWQTEACQINIPSFDQYFFFLFFLILLNYWLERNLSRKGNRRAPWVCFNAWNSLFSTYPGAGRMHSFKRGCFNVFGCWSDMFHETSWSLHGLLKYVFIAVSWSGQGKWRIADHLLVSSPGMLADFYCCYLLVGGFFNTPALTWNDACQISGPLWTSAAQVTPAPYTPGPKPTIMPAQSCAQQFCMQERRANATWPGVRIVSVVT